MPVDKIVSHIAPLQPRKSGNRLPRTGSRRNSLDLAQSPLCELVESEDNRNSENRQQRRCQQRRVVGNETRNPVPHGWVYSEKQKWIHVFPLVSLFVTHSWTETSKTFFPVRNRKAGSQKRIAAAMPPPNQISASDASMPRRSRSALNASVENYFRK